MSAPLTVTFFKPQLLHFVETMAYFLAMDPGIKVGVVTTAERESEHGEHPLAHDRLSKHPGITMATLETPPEPSSLVIYGLTRRGTTYPALQGWLKQSAASAFFPEGNHYGSRADWARELARSFPHFLRARFLILEREVRLGDFRFGCPRKVLYSTTVHPQYLREPRWRDAMFGPLPAARRRFRLTFLGNRQPPERTVRLQSAMGALKAAGNVTITPRYTDPPAPGTEALWIEYDAAAGTSGLDPLAYTAALGETDFCLSPPGWGLNWTHRTIEAMMRGTIPIIEDPELYNLPFVDGQNCLLANGADWAGAVQRCLAATDEEIARMRAGVLRLREERLLPDVAAANFRRAIRAHLT